MFYAHLMMKTSKGKGKLETCQIIYLHFECRIFLFVEVMLLLFLFSMDALQSPVKMQIDFDTLETVTDWSN